MFKGNSPTPKKRGAMKIAFPGLTHCSKIGNMQARNVNSSEKGATSWFLHQIGFCAVLYQYNGSGNFINILAML